MNGTAKSIKLVDGTLIPGPIGFLYISVAPGVGVLALNKDDQATRTEIGGYSVPAGPDTLEFYVPLSSVLKISLK